MFKFVVLSCIVSVAFGGIVHAPVAYSAGYSVEKTIVEPHATVVETPIVQHVGTKHTAVPSATSYQSQTQYHSKTIAEPIYAHGVQKTIVNTPVVKEYVEQVPAVVPVAKYVAEPVYAKTVVAAPAAYASYAAPAAYASYAAPAAYASYAAPAYARSYAAPAHYASAYSVPTYANYAHAW